MVITEKGVYIKDDPTEDVSIFYVYFYCIIIFPVANRAKQIDTRRIEKNKIWRFMQKKGGLLSHKVFKNSTDSFAGVVCWRLAARQRVLE